MDLGLIIFVKNPVRGKVKTRLAKDTGDDKALEIYLSLMEFTRRLCMNVDAERYVYYSDFIDHNDKWNSCDFNKRIQKGEDLGGKMQCAINDVLDRCDKSIIIGSDCPKLSSELLEKAFTNLNDFDVVIGPAFDGGYYLLGMKKPFPFLFQDIQWSSDHVFTDTIQKLEEKELSYKILEGLPDIDYLEDWQKFGWNL